jgi:outer membrane protein assembly factor BamB
MSWTIKLPSPQQIGNSFAVDETGGVFIASNYAMYRFDIDATGQNPKITWSYSYDRGTREKPGQQNFGTGTTPTLVGKGFCGITDNADPQMHVIVYRREKDYINNRIVCQIPVFPPGYSDTENSLIGYTGNFIVENNYGYNASVTHQTTRVVPGVARVRYDNQPCPGETVWASNQVVVPSVVSKLSLATGLIYTYTLEIEKGEHIWSITAIDAETGEVAFSVQAGTGRIFDNHYASVFIGPNGTLYVPTVLGIVSLCSV